MWRERERVKVEEGEKGNSKRSEIYNISNVFKSRKLIKALETAHLVLTDSQQKGESKSRKFHDGGLDWKKGEKVIQ